jgi:hypothetical protein
MADLYHTDKGVLIAELAGTEVPFRYLTGYGVAEFTRILLGLEPLCVMDTRGGKGKSVDSDTALSKSASKLMTPEGLLWAKKHRHAKPQCLVVSEVTPDEEENEEQELQQLINEQNMKATL